MVVFMAAPWLPRAQAGGRGHAALVELGSWGRGPSAPLDLLPIVTLSRKDRAGESRSRGRPMIRSFGITAVSSTLQLDGSGRGQVALTVSNALGRPLRARAQVQPVGETRREWLSIQGNPERSFTPDDTHHFTVQAVVPPGTPPGRYAFQLLVVNIENPDEEFALGPTVAIEVPAPASRPRQRLSRWPLVLAMAGLVLLLGVGLVLGLRGGEEPAVGGSGLSPAELTRLGFNGTNAFVDLGNPRALSFSGDVTVEAWIRPLASDGFRNILAHGHTFNPNGELFLRIHNGRYEVGSWDGRDYATSAPMPEEDLGEWVHLAGTYDGTRWRLYRNGEEVASTPAPRGIFRVDAPWAIGARGGGTERFFQGEVRDVRLWNITRTGEEIRAGMEQPPREDAFGLVGHWPLDEGRGGLARDRTARGSHGALRNTQWVTP